MKGNKTLGQQADDTSMLIVGAMQKHVDTTKQISDTIQRMSDIDGKTLGILAFLLRFAQIVTFVLTMTVWEVFFKQAFNSFVSTFIQGWSSLSEGWQIFFAGIPVALVIYVAGEYIVRKVLKIK